MTNTASHFDHTGEGNAQANPQARYQTAHSQIIFQAMEHETLILDLKQGHYFVLEGGASELWEALIGGSSVEEICAALNQRSGAEILSVDVATQFLATILSYQLLRLRESNDEPVMKLFSDGSPIRSISPKITRFTDLEAFLLADPIHEIEV